MTPERIAELRLHFLTASKCCLKSGNECLDEIERLQSYNDALLERVNTYATEHPTICYQCGGEVKPNN